MLNGLTESIKTKLRLLPASPTGSATPTTSSPSAHSTAAATARPYPAASHRVTHRSGRRAKKAAESQLSHDQDVWNL